MERKISLLVLSVGVGIFTGYHKDDFFAGMAAFLASTLFVMVQAP